jgi:hypothetical protein
VVVLEMFHLDEVFDNVMFNVLAMKSAASVKLFS